jgi:preprotein translocase subunit YajC
LSLGPLLPILLLGVVFWAMLIRPQQKARAAARTMQSALSPGDEVSTVGGIYGIVRDIDDATVDIEISEDVIVRFDRRAVNRIMRDVPAEDAERHRVHGDDEEHDAPEADAGEAAEHDAAEPVATDAPESADEPTLDGTHEAADATGPTR